NKDCIRKFVQTVVRAEVITRDALDAIDREVAALIEHSVVEAKAAPLPGPDDLLADVYVSY
ncbi:ABC transporter substrate-binding protein, partial [Mesorhizobium sp. M3A.F.Ca.ET.174.01.1.1]